MKSLLLLLVAGAAIAGAAVTPYALECEARRNPIGIDSAQPRLGWKLKSAGQNQTQSAYQILVAASPEKLAPGAADLWDSGRVASDETTWIAYGGKALAPFQRYWWKVRVWDGAGVPSEFSEAAEWTMALVGSAWRAGWISHPDHALRSGPLPLFRKEVVLDKPLRRAVVLVAGVGFHELRINGVKVGGHVLAPAWTNYRATVNYETFDVTGMLRPGANALGVMLGNGFYNVAGGRYTKYTGSFGHPRLALHLHLEFADGSVRDITTDGSWRAQDGPVVLLHLRRRTTTRGWNCPAGTRPASTIRNGAAWLRAGPGRYAARPVSPPIRYSARSPPRASPSEAA